MGRQPVIFLAGVISGGVGDVFCVGLLPLTSIDISEQAENREGGYGKETTGEKTTR